MATPKKPRALAAEAPTPEPVATPPFVPEPVVLPAMDTVGFLTRNLETVGFTEVSVVSETAPDGQVSLKLSGKNTLGAMISCNPVFTPDQLHVMVLQSLKAMVNAAGWADPHMDIPAVSL